MDYDKTIDDVCDGLKDVLRDEKKLNILSDTMYEGIYENIYRELVYYRDEEFAEAVTAFLMAQNTAETGVVAAMLKLSEMEQ